MPTYKYRREDGTTFTIRQKITEDALEKCPETGQPVERVVTGGMGFHLKGGGWYDDGYASTNGSGEKQQASKSSNDLESKGKETKTNGTDEVQKSEPSTKESA